MSSSLNLWLVKIKIIINNFHNFWNIFKNFGIFKFPNFFWVFKTTLTVTLHYQSISANHKQPNWHETPCTVHRSIMSLCHWTNKTATSTRQTFLFKKLMLFHFNIFYSQDNHPGVRVAHWQLKKEKSANKLLFLVLLRADYVSNIF